MRRVRQILLLSIVSVFVWLTYLLFYSSTPAIHDRLGRKLPTSIASLERVRLGGVDQWILIRGGDVRNPILLFLHGGPGMPTMFLAHKFQHELENNFVVVQWDRRGAGKSFSSNILPASMSVEQEIADTHELTDLLRQRFHQRKIYLVDFSYGSYLGMLVVKRYPDLFSAYIGIGQEGCLPVREHEIQDDWIRLQAETNGDRNALNQLEGKEPLDREKWLFKYGAEIRSATNWSVLLKAGLTASEYDLRDVMNVKKGVEFTSHHFKWNAIRGALIADTAGTCWRHQRAGHGAGRGAAACSRTWIAAFRKKPDCLFAFQMTHR